jgi:DNA-binding NarL/FixJ family response regulator
VSVRVVIADDDDDARATLRRLLERPGGFEVVGAARDGDEAQQMIELLRPAVAVLDVHMPRSTGVDVLRAVRAVGDPTPVVLLTADPAAAAGAAGLPSVAVLVKTLATAQETIATVLGAASGVEDGEDLAHARRLDDDGVEPGERTRRRRVARQQDQSDGPVLRGA